ncbi:Oxygen tolerance [compost metagenome]
MRWLALLLALVATLAAAAEPEVRVRTRLAQADSPMVGGTLELQVDLLVDTWFSSPPQLQKLELEGALVSAPSSEATHLTEQIDGRKFFGLRFVYRISPQRAQRFDIPALDIQVQPGQGSGPLTLRTEPQSFVARQMGGAGDMQGLVAQSVEFTQQVEPSHDPLRVGDSVTRRLSVRAEGAQAMLIPPPEFVEVEGLKRYVQTPSVKPLGDGRGTVIGGSRDDAVTYVLGEGGKFRLPAIELRWRDAGTGEERRASVPEVTIEAKAGAAYQAPFSIADDLRELGRKAQVRIAGHWLLAACVLLVAGAAFHFGRPWIAGVTRAWRQWRERRRQAWLDSAEHAWRQARRQLAARPLRLDALYLWIRRSTGSLDLVALLRPVSATLSDRLLAFLAGRYGRRAGSDAGLEDALPELRRTLARQPADAQPRGGLKALNPRGSQRFAQNRDEP